MSEMEEREGEGVPGTRRHVVGDRKKLSKLNDSLEKFIQKAREKEMLIADLRGQLEESEKEYKGKLKQRDTANQMRFEEARAQKSKILGEMAELRSTIEELKHKKYEAEQRSRAAASQKEKLRKDLEDVESRFSDAMKTGEDYKIRIEKLERGNQSLKDQLEEKETEVMVMRAGKSENVHKLQAKEVQVKNLTDDINVLQNRINAMEVEHKKALGEARDKYSNLKTAIEDNCNKKLQDFCKKRTDAYKKEKEQWMQIFRAEWDDKIRVLNEERTALTHDNRVLDEKITKLQRSLLIKSDNNTKLQEKLATKTAAYENELAKIKEEKKQVEQSNEAQLSQLTNDICSLRSQQDSMLKERTRLSNEKDKMKKRLKDYEAKYKSLVEEREKNYLEIQKFDAILSQAEYRRDLDKPKRKKRKLNYSDTGVRERTTAKRGRKFDPAGELQSRGSADHMVVPQSLVFSSFDPEEGSLSLKNQTSGDINLKGYRISNNTIPKYEKFLPDRLLKAGNQVRIVFGREAVLEPGDIHWDEDVWSQNSEDAACLYDTNSKMLAYYKIDCNAISSDGKQRCVIN